MNWLRKMSTNAPSSATSGYKRRASHAGSWYRSNSDDLDDELEGYLSNASGPGWTEDEGVPNACISPHAGFAYSGPTAGYSFAALKEAIERNGELSTIVILHPSHHVYLNGLAVSGASAIETPLGDLTIDADLRSRLLATKGFSTMNQDVDEDEHSGEMQYPFIAKIIKDADRSSIRVLAIMVGSIAKSTERSYGALLAPILEDSRVFTVISSDFCHWGQRFRYTPQPPQDDEEINEVYEYIERLDRKGMQQIELQRPGAFADYLKTYKNTICGRHPISVWLNALQNQSTQSSVRFVEYAQSNKARTADDFSVSYASAVCRVRRTFSGDKFTA